jgi:diadenosine tetraphosphate (Ap4A) HIT family hydrolase
MNESSPEQCPFCEPSKDRIIEVTEHAYAMLDAYPVSQGHTLVVVRRHVANVFEIREEELSDAVRLIRSAQERINRNHQPGGYNVGINVGKAAGQTVMHVHFHVIPRYSGDSTDPKGGVRNVIVGKGSYA